MPYATTADLQAFVGERRLVQLTDTGLARTNTVVLATAERALGDASAVIDGYIAPRVALPLASVPAILRVLCTHMAVHFLMVENADEPSQKRYESAIAYLQNVAVGKVALFDSTTGAAPPTPAGGTVSFSLGQKVMGREASYDEGA